MPAKIVMAEENQGKINKDMQELIKRESRVEKKRKLLLKKKEEFLHIYSQLNQK